MNLLELCNSLLKKEFRNFYVFAGAEYTILDIYIQKVADGIGANIIETDTVDSVYRNLDRRNLFDSGKQLYLVRYDKEFLTEESIWKDIVKKLERAKATLIIKYSDLDARSKFHKTFDEYITEFQPLSVEVLTKYIKNDVDLTDKCCKYLCDITHNDYGRILLEIDKIRSLASFRSMSDMDAFKECYNYGAFYIDVEGEMFDLIDAILDRDVKSVYELLEESKERGDNPLAVISLLHTKVKTVLQIQTAGNIKNIADSTGLTGFQIKNSKPFVGRYSNSELVRFLKYIRYCDRGVKDGSIQPEMVVDYLLVNIL